MGAVWVRFKNLRPTIPNNINAAVEGNGTWLPALTKYRLSNITPSVVSTLMRAMWPGKSPNPTHYQYTIGLIPEEEWDVVLGAVKVEARNIVHDGHLLNNWRESKFGFRASFANIISAEIADYTAKSKTSASQN